jgi:hypothetical protein
VLAYLIEENRVLRRRLLALIPAVQCRLLQSDDDVRMPSWLVPTPSRAVPPSPRAAAA